MNSALISALSHFGTRDGEVIIAGQKVTEIVNKYSTPLYVYDQSVIKWRHQALRDALPPQIRIYYAVKANPNIEILRILGGLYDGLDVASKGEIENALKAGIPASVMSFAGPGKTIDELKYSVEIGLENISIENEREIDHLIEICSSLKKSASISIRINPDFDLAKSGLKMGGGPKQFGIDSEKVSALIMKINQIELLNFEGIHIYAGSQNLNSESLIESFQKIIQYSLELSKMTNITLKRINLGGGFGIPYFAKDEDMDLIKVGKGLKDLLKDNHDYLKKTKLIIELGRFIIGEAGIYMTKILYKKKSRGEIFIIIDGGMHQHLPASGNFGQSLVRRPFPITVLNKVDNPPEKVNIVGPLCTPLDTFGMGTEIPEAEEGDLIGVFNAGAYGYTASPLKFLSHKEPGEIIF